jgi:uncharacterized protein involved in exopolysaccharide biosynthesis
MIILAKHKKVVVAFPLVVAIVSAAISFVLPNEYTATTKLLPPQQQQSGAAALLSQLGGMAGAAAGVAGIKNPNDMYVGMLKSRTVADRMIEQFHLKKVYETDSQEGARKKLASNTTISSGKDGLITIEVDDKNKKLVAGLANGYVAELLRLTKVLAVTEASQRRVFFERQLELSKNNLANAEISLKSALETHGVISVDTESRAILETVGRLRAQVSAKEIQLNSMRAFVTTSNPEFRRVEEELNGLRAELTKLENGRTQEESAENGKKQTGLENIKILRDVKYYQMLYELLAKQYEVARLDEAKDASIIQVLDPAVEPERRSKPKRSFIVLISGALALLLSTGWVYLVESHRRALELPGGAARWAALKKYLRLR